MGVECENVGFTVLIECSMISGRADVTVSSDGIEMENTAPENYSEAISLSCVISGLTEAAEVVWTKEGSDVTNLAEGKICKL